MVVRNKAEASFEQIIMARTWNAIHGGVYVPVTESSQPNPYLEDSQRDIKSVDGMFLTKINPAYMTRQIAELNLASNDLQFHITSLKPIRPANKADAWEHKALTLFESGTTEILELVQEDSISRYRYMAPLITNESCLKCHEQQGYKIGDVRGGISVSFSSNIYTIGVQRQLVSFGIIHLFLLIGGTIGLLAYSKHTKAHFSIIENKNKELIRTNATKDKFISILAHDLRSPFQATLGFIDLLKTGLKTLSIKELEKYVHNIDTSTRGSFELLENLLLWAQSQGGNIKITKEKLHLRNEIILAANPYQSAAEIKKIKMHIDISNAHEVYADKFTLRIIIANLLSNAIKFTPAHGNIRIEALQNNGFSEISIRDNGVGIPTEVIPQLFLIEADISTLGTEKEKGTGLGLLLCKEFIENQGGKIRVESEVGKGTTFTITLPDQVTNNEA